MSDTKDDDQALRAAHGVTVQPDPGPIILCERDSVCPKHGLPIVWFCRYCHEEWKQA